MKINGKEYSEPELRAYIDMLLRLLSDARLLLSAAFYADYKLQNKSDAVIFRIDSIQKEANGHD